MKKHCKFSPSGADRWLNCPYSVKDSSFRTWGDHTKADRGTALHTLCEKAAELAIEGKEPAIIPTLQNMRLELDGKKGEFRKPTSEELLIAKKYAQLITRYINKERNNIILEKTIGVGDIFGTPDAVVVSGSVIEVIDFKSGSFPVDPTSSQLKIYGYLALTEYNPDAEYVNLVIFQPETSPMVKEARFKVEDIKDFFDNKVIHAIERAKSDNPEQVAGAHCIFCPHRLKCKTYLNESAESLLAIVDIAAALRNNSEPTDDLLKKFIYYRSTINSLLREINIYLIDKLDNGGQINGLGIKYKKGRRKWAKSEAEIAEYLRNKGFYDLTEYFEPKSPAKIEKILKLHGIDVADLENMVERADASPVLFEIEDVSFDAIPD